jgi:hypothetical protein
VIPDTVDSTLQIDADFPGGNIIVERIDGDDVYVRQDLRDNAIWWFYWYFRVRGAAGRTLTFHFDDGKVIGLRGPAVSTDGGATWQWMGEQAALATAFTYTFPQDTEDVRFSFGIPYAQSNLHEFLKPYHGHPHLVVETLCETAKGRAVECLRLGQVDGEPDYRILLTSRHHACEAMANYVLEGMMAAILHPESQWFQNHVECLVVPFIDKDGVEDGDQGKGRKPHDHNRDYSGESIYPSTRVLREKVPQWAGGRLQIALDLHCPSIRGRRIHLVGSANPQIWQEQVRFSEILEQQQTGPLVYHAADNIPYGQGWNTAQNWVQGDSCSRWAGQIPGMRLSSGVEIPYADHHGVEMTPAVARAFGADLVKAIRCYLS